MYVYSLTTVSVFMNTHSVGTFFINITAYTNAVPL